MGIVSFSLTVSNKIFDLEVSFVYQKVKLVQHFQSEYLVSVKMLVCFHFLCVTHVRFKPMLLESCKLSRRCCGCPDYLYPCVCVSMNGILNECVVCKVASQNLFQGCHVILQKSVCDTFVVVVFFCGVVVYGRSCGTCKS